MNTQITATQLRIYEQYQEMAFADDATLEPPRVTDMDIHRREAIATGCPDDLMEEYFPANGVMLYVGADVTDQMDCGGACDERHIQYAMILPNGMTNEPIPSGSIIEALTLPEGARWDDARAVEPHEWPVNVRIPDSL